MILMIFHFFFFFGKSLSYVRLFASPWNSLGQNTGVGSLSLLQEIFNQTQVSRIAGWFFTSWATKEAQEYWRR